MAKPPANVDQFLSALRHPFKEGIEELRAAILQSNAAITERVKWNAPSFCDRGEDRVTFRFPPKGGLQLVFHRGAKTKDSTSFRFDDRSGLLEWAAVDRGVVSFSTLEDLRSKRQTVVALVNAWIEGTRERS